MSGYTVNTYLNGRLVRRSLRDAADRLLSEEKYDGSRLVAVLTHSYDNTGELSGTKEVYPVEGMESEIVYVYDEQRRVVLKRILHNDGYETQIRHQYDVEGWSEIITTIGEDEEESRAEYYRYDEHKRLIEEREVLDGYWLEYHIRRTYYGDSERIQDERHYDEDGDMYGKSTFRYELTPQGNIATEYEELNQIDADEPQDVSMGLDDILDNSFTQTKHTIITTYFYDAHGNITREQTYDSNDERTKLLTYRYNDDQRVLEKILTINKQILLQTAYEYTLEDSNITQVDEFHSGAQFSSLDQLGELA